MSAKAEPAVKGNGEAKGNGHDTLRELPIIRLDALKLREHAHNVYYVAAPTGLKVADVLAREIWAAVAFQLVRGDIIRADFAAENKLVELWVKQAVPGRASIAILHTHDVGAQEAMDDDAMPPNHRIYFHQADGWCVERTEKDGSVTLMAKGTEHGGWDRRAARLWLEGHATIRQSTPGRRMV